MTGQRATLSSMEPTTPHLEPWRDALRARGLNPDDPAPEPTPEEEARATQEYLAERRAEARQARWERRRPAMYATASLDDLDASQNPQVAADWLAGDGATLLLAGPVGTGKTHAAYAVGNAATAAGLWVEAWTMADLLEALRPGGEEGAAADVRGCDLLLLDDLTVLKVSDWAVEQFTALMDHRLRERRRQVVTTNAAYQPLVESWGDRAMDRLRFRWTVLTFTGESRRKAAW